MTFQRKKKKVYKKFYTSSTQSSTYNTQDKYFNRAKKEGYRARSAYKLLQLLEQMPYLIKKGDSVLDLGCFPGSWMQVIKKCIQAEGTLVGLDLQDMKSFDATNIQTHICDVTDKNTMNTLLSPYPVFDVVTSDLAPNATGIKSVDQNNMCLLIDAILHTCKKYMKANGICIFKCFHGLPEDYARKYISSILHAKASCIDVSATRGSSKECYIIIQKI
jgi:23S rRNA (uridine2552-2'-O)-methyltransferase